MPRANHKPPRRKSAGLAALLTEVERRHGPRVRRWVARLLGAEEAGEKAKKIGKRRLIPRRALVALLAGGLVEAK